MILQTTWQGCDSALAAPLVLDLARLTARAHESGLSGPLDALAFYFKDPVGDAPSGLADQYEALTGFARSLREAGPGEGTGLRQDAGEGRELGREERTNGMGDPR
jgi:myo-inositol-1-phosphate synthase